MGNTALAKLPAKVQVGLFVCDLVGYASIRVLVTSTTCTCGQLPEFCLRICDV